MATKESRGFGMVLTDEMEESSKTVLDFCWKWTDFGKAKEED